jgi:amino acid transporter
MNTIQEIFLFNRYSLSFCNLIIKKYSAKTKWIGSVFLILAISSFIFGFVCHIKNPEKPYLYIFSVITALLSIFIVNKGRKLNYKVLLEKYNKKYELKLRNNNWSNQTIEELRMKILKRKYNKYLKNDKKLEILINHFEAESKRNKKVIKISNTAYFIIILTIISGLLNKLINYIEIEWITQYLNYGIFFGISFICVLILLYYYIKIPLTILLNVKSNAYWLISTRLKNIRLDLKQED